MLHHGDALPATDATIGASPEFGFLAVLSFAQKRPATEECKTQPESAQKTTAAGTNWEFFGFV
jgi:hypothetical protein